MKNKSKNKTKPDKSQAPAPTPDPTLAPDLTEEQKRFVDEAKKIFQEADKLPAPSPNMRKKMQSTHGD